MVVVVVKRGYKGGSMGGGGVCKEESMSQGEGDEC